MASPDAVAVAEGLVAAVNEADWERMRGALTAGCTYEETATKRHVEGRDAVVELWRTWKRAIPDATGTVTAVVPGEASVALEVRWEGTMSGPFGDFRPSGRRQSSAAALLFWFEGPLIREFRHYFDSLALFQILGVNLPVQGVNVPVPRVQGPPIGSP